MTEMLYRITFFVLANAAVYFIAAVTLQDINIFPHIWNQELAAERFWNATLLVVWLAISLFFTFVM